jgi:hypothetical protein
LDEEGNSNLFLKRGREAGSLQRGDNHKKVKMGWCHLKTLFSRAIGPILIKLGTNQGIQVCSNDGDFPYPRGDTCNSKRVKID